MSDTNAKSDRLDARIDGKAATAASLVYVVWCIAKREPSGGVAIPAGHVKTLSARAGRRRGS